jgi:hypothetical protein
MKNADKSEAASKLSEYSLIAPHWTFLYEGCSPGDPQSTNNEGKRTYEANYSDVRSLAAVWMR